MTTPTEKAARVAAGLTGVLGIGLAGRFLLDPATAADGYGVPTTGDNPYLAVKGIRDLGAGLTVLGFLGRHETRALGPALLALGVIPVGDALVVRHHGGPLSTSLGIHGLTALVMVAAGTVLTRSTRDRQGETVSTETEHNKAVVRRFYEPFRTGDTSTYLDVLAPGWVNHPADPGAAPGPAGAPPVGYYRHVLPDLDTTTEAMIAEGDLVAVRTTHRGTHSAEFLGVPATGRRIELRTHDTHRLVAGRIVETWHLEDFAGLRDQLTAPSQGPRRRPCSPS